MQNALFASEIRLFGAKDFCMILSDIPICGKSWFVYIKAQWNKIFWQKPWAIPYLLQKYVWHKGFLYDFKWHSKKAQTFHESF